MLKFALPIVLSAAVAGLLTGALPASGASTKKTSKTSSKSKRKASNVKSKSAAAAKPAARKSASARKRTGKRSRRAPVSSWRTGQQEPSPERYREIQQALISRGYLAEPATGQWGAESVEALKRFQRDQNLKDDGKLDALSLIALGLGPKRTTFQQTRAQP